MTREELVRRVAAGESGFRYLLFWGHAADRPNAQLSQWYPSPFTVEGVAYPTAEHWMMAEKARLFGDARTRDAILAARSPGAAKKLGREVQGFDEATWGTHRFGIVVAGSIHKFGHSAALREALLRTGDQVLVEASPTDRVWGIGLAQDHPDARDPARWRGENLLGFALMDARDELRRSED